MQFHYDALNDFGTMAGNGDFPNIIDCGEATVERMTVDVKSVNGDVEGGVIIITLSDAPAEDGPYQSLIGMSRVHADVLNRDGYSMPIPRHRRFLRLSISGIQGTVRALLNSQQGI